MQSIGIASFAAGLLLVLGAQGDEATLKKEKAALQGAWKIVSLETATGKDAKVEGAILDFDKDGKNFTFTLNGDTKKATFKLYAAGKPKEIDIISPDGKTLEGVYQIEKDTLKICLATDINDGRPNEFATKEGKNFVLIVLERVK